MAAELAMLITRELNHRLGRRYRPMTLIGSAAPSQPRRTGMWRAGGRRCKRPQRRVSRALGALGRWVARGLTHRPSVQTLSSTDRGAHTAVKIFLQPALGLKL